MSNNIDDIFKEGLNDMEFSGREAIWERMEKELDKKPVPAANKKRVAYLLLLLGIVAGASFLASHFNTAGPVVSSKVKGVAGSAKAGGIATKDYSTAINSDAKTVGEHFLVSENALTADKAATAEMQPDIADNKLIRSSDEKKLAAAHFTAKAKHIVQLKGKTHSSVLQDADAVLMNDDETLPWEMIAGRMPGLFEKDLYTTAATVNTEIAAAAAPFLQLPLRTKKPAADGKISLALVAGSDVFTIGKGAGYYAGLIVSRSFSKGMSLSFGVNYSSSNLSESYRLSNKPSQLEQADAEISRVSMLRFPIMIEQQIGKGKFTAVAALVPVYILDAAIYNLPPSVSGNPANYRKFTIDDIRRLNALFSAGIRYNIVRKFAVELSGSYGLTELVKNSYINQSSVNGNFKNVQVGLVYLLR